MQLFNIKLFHKAPDGGHGSGVTGYFLVEIKPLFSVVLLRFSQGSREAYHEHAFSALTLWLSGRVEEHRIDGGTLAVTRFPCHSRLKYTPRHCFHKIIGITEAWALSFRGPWVDYWREMRKNKTVTLTHGRRVVDVGGDSL